LYKYKTAIANKTGNFQNKIRNKKVSTGDRMSIDSGKENPNKLPHTKLPVFWWLHVAQNWGRYETEKWKNSFAFLSSNIHTRGCYNLISCLSKKLLSKFAYLHFCKRSSLFKTRMVRKRVHFF
jgi:hypothetical protein